MCAVTGSSFFFTLNRILLNFFNHLYNFNVKSNILGFEVDIKLKLYLIFILKELIKNDLLLDTQICKIS
jgi:hypothetical protein